MEAWAQVRIFESVSVDKKKTLQCSDIAKVHGIVGDLIPDLHKPYGYLGKRKISTHFFMLPRILQVHFLYLRRTEFNPTSFDPSQSLI